MGDHVAEFKRILDYKDMLLQTNPGSTCVVNLKDSESGNGIKQFHSFYIFLCYEKGFPTRIQKMYRAGWVFSKGNFVVVNFW